MRRWPDPQAWAARPLSAKLQTNSSTRPFIMFLMVTGRLRPGYDYLVARKLTGFRRYLNDSQLQPDLSRFDTAATELGFTEKVTTRTASQAVARLLIQTGARLDELTDTDLDDLTAACQAHQNAPAPAGATTTAPSMPPGRCCFTSGCSTRRRCRPPSRSR